jgi:hypothetical protein
MSGARNLGLMSSTGMIIDGVFASQAIDSSGEILDVEGCDISTLDKDGVANYEHKEGDKKGSGNNGEEIVGKIIYAKKILKVTDCENSRQRVYWDKVKIPFIYGMVRLYDGAGHSGAQALAAQIRDHHANGEPILVRYSIEGSTLERDPDNKNHLRVSVARRVAMTLKPCNRTCDSGIVEDPRAPDGFEKKPADEKVSDLLDGLMDKNESVEHPAYTKLGGVHELEMMPMLDTRAIAKIKLVAKAKMLKALSKGDLVAFPGNPNPVEDKGKEADVESMKRWQLDRGQAPGKPPAQPPKSQEYENIVRRAVAVMDEQDRGRKYKEGQLVAHLDRQAYPGVGKVSRAFYYDSKSRGPIMNPETHPAGHYYEVHWPDKNMTNVVGQDQLTPHLTVQKALTAGSYGVAPSALTGGAALQVEDRGLRGRMIDAVKAYKPKDKFDKAEFKAMAKTFLPEADDRFLDHFSDVAEDYHVKRLNKAIDLSGDAEVKPQPDLNWAEPARGQKQEQVKAPVGPPNPKAKIPGAGGGAKKRLTLHPNGALELPDGQKLSLHIPKNDAYLSIMHPDQYDISPEKRDLYKRSVHEPWQRAMKSWMELNKRAREGTIPRSIVKLAGLFSAMSPNTGVPLQERHFGHVMDMLHEGTMRLDQPIEQHHIADFEHRAQGPFLPQWNREHFERVGPAPGVASVEEAQARAAEPNKFGNAKSELPQIAGLRHLDEIMPHLEHMFATHKADGRKMAEELMNMKSAYKRKATASNAAEAKEHFKDKHPVVAGFGPKLTRYMLSMAGAGNIIVPDRHMTRSLYNLGVEDPLSEYLATRVVTQAKNEPFLRSLDQHFYNKHPAVQHVLQMYPEHFKGHEEQAIFPAFWLHWLHIPHYEQNQGRSTEATIGGTDHRVFWDSVQDSMRRHGIPVRGEHYEYNPPDTSFNFGENVAKAEVPHPMSHVPFEQRAMGAMQELAMKHGETGAMIGYFAHIVPALLDGEKGKTRRDPHAVIRKMESLTVDLRKAAADMATMKRMQAVPQRPTHRFAGNPVYAGEAQTADGAYDLLHEDDDHYIAVPKGQKPEPHTLKRLPKIKEGTHFTVSRRPAVFVADL